MKLIDLLKGIDYKVIKGSLDIDIVDLSYDSRDISLGYGFVCLRGIDSDGHDYISSAVSKGCNCAFVDKDIDVEEDITVIRLNDCRQSLSYLSSNLFGNPGESLIKIGITGTKGKTTISWLIRSILSNANTKVGVIGTMGTFIEDKLYEHKNTTPSSYLIQKYMRKMVDSGIKYLVMEVSSQALKDYRVNNIYFDYGIFTNLSMDHVGPREHSSFDDYKYSKSKLFRQCRVGIFNSDDSYYRDMVNDSTCIKYFYGFNGKDLTVKDYSRYIDNDFIGIKFSTSGLVNDSFLISNPGVFSLYNATCVLLLCKLLNVNIKTVKKTFKSFSVPGRCQIFNLKRGVKVVIDYAHNNVSMESIIKTMKEYNCGRVVCVFGCGGGRSKDIRIGLGEVASKYADLSIVTSDNPRYDDINDINNDIVKGIKKNNGKYIVIPDREEAIKYSVQNALDSDIILLLGKGHERFQEVNGIVYPFDEESIINQFI